MSHSESITVRDVMRTTFSTIDGNATVSEALLLMKSAKTSTIIVNRRHDLDEFGLITSSDIARQVMAKNRAPNRVNVYEIMEFTRRIKRYNDPKNKNRNTTKRAAITH